MRKFKGKLSRFLALALTVSLLTLPEMAVFASANQGVLGSPGKIMSAERFSHATGSDAGMDEGTLEDSKDDVENGEGEEKKVATWANALTGAVSKAKSGEREIKLDGAKVEEEAVNTLLPIEEVDAYLVLRGYSNEELKVMPVETVLGMLKDNNRNPIQIPEDARVLLVDSGEEYREIDRNGTIDLSPQGKITAFKITLLIGSGKQLDRENIRYNIMVYVSDVISEKISLSFYTDGKRADGSYGKTYQGGDGVYRKSHVLDEVDIPVYAVFCETDLYGEGKTYNISIGSQIAAHHKDIHVDVYPMKKFMDYYQNGSKLDGAITDQILNQDKNILKHIGGYEGHYAESGSENFLDADNFFCITYTDVDTGKLIGYFGLIFTICSDVEKAIGNVSLYESGEMKVAAKEKIIRGSVGARIKLNLESESNGITIDYTSPTDTYKLMKGCPREGKYYYTFNENSHIEKVVKGQYRSIKEADAAGAEDITSQVLPKDKSKVPYGYLIDSERWQERDGSTVSITYSEEFTVFFDDYTAISFKIVLRHDSNLDEGNADEYPDENKPYLFFDVTGAEGYDGKNIDFISDFDDSYWSYGYRTLFLNDINADLTRIKPKFLCSEGAKVYVGEEQKSGISEQDFSDGPVYYTVYFEDQLENYPVSFVKKEVGSKLFVNGPDERTIFLDNYYGENHDIVITNVGNDELTGLNVELINPVNIRLDDYWIIGGKRNDILAAFDTSPNLAKIRLLPDGEGDVEGTLKISADGQDDVYIKLTGHAGNPEIITRFLKDAVEYVPYSYMVATNNIYDWNGVEFSIEKGRLPSGLQLNPLTGEIYGIPQECGEFQVKIRASYSAFEFSPSYADFWLTVKEPTNENVFLASDEGYEVMQPIGTETAEGTYEYVIRSYSDQVFISAGEYSRFVDLWLNGERLTDEVDYTKESGSTKITVKSQTFKDKAKKGSNTIAAEFRESDKSNELKRTAQNFTMDIPESDEENKTPDTEQKPPENNDSANKTPSIGIGSGFGNGGGSGGGRDSSKGNNTANIVPSQTDISLYSDDSWVKDEIGWRCKMPDGNWITNTWFRLPYQGTVEWYYFNEQGYMVTGLLAHNGLLYYLNPISDGTQGKMITGWKKIDGKWYYFKEIDDGTMGAMMSDVWIGEYYVNSQGVWEG